MKVNRIDHNRQADRMERINLQYKRDEDYRKVIEKRGLDRIVAERIQRNIRLGLDKGQNIDVEV